MKLSGCGYLIKEGLKSIWHNRAMSIASVGVLVSCLVLTGAAMVVSYNVSAIVTKVGADNMVNVYLEDDISEVQAVIEIGPKIREIPNVSDALFVSKEEAIADYKDELGQWYDEMTGEGNPLPNAYKVTMSDLSLYDDTVQQLSQIDGIQKISDRRDIASKLTSLNNLVTVIGFWLVVVLGVVSLFIVSNTIRITMYSRRFEISIMKSVGATNTFVRIPFFIEGMTLGFIAGIITSLILFFIYEGVAAVIVNVAEYLVAIPYDTFMLPISAIFIASGMIVGALGSLISMHKYLKIEGGETLGW
ncbi:MAG: permease-like cell division protein FtsX [Clostridiales bacterium]|nr:permease-like cell division protein FtsX [Clostridiales bacterium]